MQNVSLTSILNVQGQVDEQNTSMYRDDKKWEKLSIKMRLRQQHFLNGVLISEESDDQKHVFFVILSFLVKT